MLRPLTRPVNASVSYLKPHRHLILHVRQKELLNWVNETIDDESLHSLIVVAIFAVVFLAIHPFQDGIGRLSRILTSLLLLKTGYTYIPYIFDGKCDRKK